MRIFLIASVFLLAVCGAFYWLLSQAGQSQELSQKPDISRLQGFELKYQGKDLDKPLLFEKEEGTCSVGILSADGQTRAWILLYSPTTAIAYKGVVKPYQINQQTIDLINKECKVGPQAARELQEHLNHVAL